MQIKKKNRFVLTYLMRIFALCLFAIFSIAISGMSVSAEEINVEVDGDSKLTVSPKAANVKIDGDSKLIVYRWSKENEPTKGYHEPYIVFHVNDSIDKYSIRSNNRKVVKDICIREKGHAVQGSHDTILEVLCALNPGTADISFENQSGKKYAVTVEVLPYENPIESITITNVEKGKNLAKKINKQGGYYPAGEGWGLTFSKKTSVPKIKITAAKDWEIVKISICCLDAQWINEYRKISNVNARTKTVKLQKAGKGDNIYIGMHLKNKKTGAFQHVTFGRYFDPDVCEYGAHAVD